MPESHRDFKTRQIVQHAYEGKPIPLGYLTPAFTNVIDVTTKRLPFTSSFTNGILSTQFLAKVLNEDGTISPNELENHLRKPGDWLRNYLAGDVLPILHDFFAQPGGAWASTFGDTSTELDLQPSGKYKPVTRFSQFVNVPELIAMFRTFADVVLPADLRQYVKVPAISGGRRQIVTAEAGTGVNVQPRLKALHHLDVPWLPSHIEQREGRIVRQGNQHDEVDIFAYATLGSLDATMWQNNERKARFIAAALSGDTSVRRLEDMGEGQANQFAMAKAIASGDPRLMQKAGLESEIARLERLEAADIDDQNAIRRQIRDAERDIELSTRRIAEIDEDIKRHLPTVGDDFKMAVGKVEYDERKLAGRALMKEILTLVQLQQEGDFTIAAIGGFALEYRGERFGRDGYQYATMLNRTGADYEIELPVTATPGGAVMRLEHALSTMEAERFGYRNRLSDAERRLASYRPRLGEAFAFGAELALKRDELADIERDLAATQDSEEAERAAA